MASASAQHLTDQQSEAYALNLLPEQERAAVERHLASCLACRRLAGDAPTMPTFHEALANSILDGQREGEAAMGAADEVPAGLKSSKRYMVLGKIGGGGMGDVYKAIQLSMGREVALKVMKPSLVADAKAVERFHREVRAAALLHQPDVMPGIVVTYDAEREGDTHFLVMALVSGIDLARLVRKVGPLDVSLACGLARQTAAALQHAHDRGIIHRDIKPHNLMASREGKVTVLDFGLVRLTREGGDGASTTAQVMGTPDYMAPEQVRTPKSVDAKTDVYSLGGTLFFLLTGRPPFSGEDWMAVLMEHAIQPPPPLAEARPDAPPELAALVGRMLAKRQEDRPELAEVARTLRQIGLSQTAPGPGRDEVFDQPTITQTRPRKGAGWAVRLSILAVLGVLGVLGVLVGHLAGMLGSTNEGNTPTRAGLSSEPGGGAAPKKQPPPPKKTVFPPEFVCASGGKLIYLKGGRFQMGSPEGEKERSGKVEQPHGVTVSAFYLGETEVTQAQFLKVMGYNPSHFSRNAQGKKGLAYLDFSKPGGGVDKLAEVTSTDDFPVENVSWEEAKAYCERLNQIDKERLDGWVYRLPREAEWEYACRGGAVDFQAFHFGNILDNSETQANFNGNLPYGSTNKSRYLERTREVRAYKPNAFGLYDMHGNVWEWCEDAYEADYYAKCADATDPGGPVPAADSGRVVRGGSWVYGGQNCRSANRNEFDPAWRSRADGFRVALVAPERR